MGPEGSDRVGKESRVPLTLGQGSLSLMCWRGTLSEGHMPLTPPHPPTPCRSDQSRPPLAEGAGLPGWRLVSGGGPSAVPLGAEGSVEEQLSGCRPGLP